ncbi:Malonyl CoA-acyl carrier protein transacylase [Oligella ureolytica]|uniref:Malonyl CoA-acyl carrier protein transacylase n=1 Tax=Oligella ureolytica TaxID=90244 RepID=A0A378XI80_9BURK|nr:ACP S-malonyltransferase [Oligella ureolytica]QPT39624.1 ACP S-malonyltransferase [Oligella ureolytica]SUA56975.1 Malonyl CoA-acyl carrier protein transacylase [Oligella ureolytica]
MTKLAFVFPGQGSQSVGMLDSWADNDAVKAVIDEASQALSQDLTTLIADGPAEDLNLTTNTQPVMLAASYAMYQAYLSAGGKSPELVAGHSLGEYTALAAAGTITLSDAVRLVRVRADAMQSAVPVGQGGMAAILGLDDEAVLEVCQAASTEDSFVEAVNFNAPAQVVVAGHKEAIDRVCVLAKEHGAKRALPLAVSAPFHSRLLEPAAQVLEEALAGIELQRPAMPVINNVDVDTADAPDDIVDALVRQAWHPVRWVETIRKMKEDGVTHVVECGPGKVLSGLVKRIEPELVMLNINDPASLDATLKALEDQANHA